MAKIGLLNGAGSLIMKYYDIYKNRNNSRIDINLSEDDNNINMHIECLLRYDITEYEYGDLNKDDVEFIFKIIGALGADDKISFNNWLNNIYYTLFNDSSISLQVEFGSRTNLNDIINIGPLKNFNLIFTMSILKAYFVLFYGMYKKYYESYNNYLIYNDPYQFVLKDFITRYDLIRHFEETHDIYGFNDFITFNLGQH